MYLDSGSADKKKDYTFIKAVLDDAINDFVEKAGPIKKEVVRRGQLIFKHNTTFPCLKQPENSSRDGYYAIHHMREFVRDQHQLLLPSSLQEWRKDFANAPDADVHLEIYRIQQKIAQIIHRDVCCREGVFYYGPIPPTNTEIEARLEMQGDGRPFNTLQGIRPFPPKPKSTK
jgi:hypothetical protein